MLSVLDNERLTRVGFVCRARRQTQASMHAGERFLVERAFDHQILPTKRPGERIFFGSSFSLIRLMSSKPPGVSP